MSQTSSHSPQPTEELPHDLVDLRTAIESLPVDQRTRIEPILLRVVESTRRRRRILNWCRTRLSQLRLDMKYCCSTSKHPRERDDFHGSGPS